MVFAVLVVYLCLFCEPQSILGILVSPDSALRNATIPTTEANLNKTTAREDKLSLADRNRRLIPYMTFYIPNDYPINQHYNFAPDTHQVQYQPQQKQVIALYQAHHDQPSADQHQQQQQHLQQQPSPIQNKPQSHKHQPRYPQRQQQYQAIVYGTRHQAPSAGGAKGGNFQYHLERAPVPMSFKDSNIVKPQPMHSTTKINLTPFTPENKLPGHFTPIIYGGGDQDNYDGKPQVNDDIKQHQDDLREGPIRHQSTPIYTTPAPVVPILVSPSPRPIYPIINDDQQKNQHLGLLRPLQQHPQEISAHDLTPQEKYVRYLQEQIQLKHQQNQQHHHKPQHIPDQDLQQIQYQQRPQQIFIVSSSPQPPPDNHIYYEKPEEAPMDHQILYQPAGDEIDHGALNHSPTPHPVIYKNSPSPATQAQYNNNNYPKYVKYVLPESQISSHDTEEMMKQIAYITTPAPVIVTPVMTTYKKRPVQHLKPVTQIRPVYVPAKQFESQKINVHFHKPTAAPQSVRQHLTETTQVPPPTLTTYHPKLDALKPQYVPLHYSTPKPLRIPPSSKYSYKPIIVTEMAPKVKPILTKQHKNSDLPLISSNSLAEILRKLQESNHLPRTLTPENIDNSIQTLIKILNNLKQSQTIVESPPQHHEPNYDEYDDTSVNVDPSHPGPNSGRPGIDYPALAEIPHTSFNCKEQRYKGFFGDPETSCQVWHYCDLNGGQASFLCPNGTIFSQVALTCDWWFNVKCSSTAQLYVLNERLYKYILPFTPKFPEDYSGPLVDKYLALKFQEMEEKMRREKMKGKDETSSEKEDEPEEGGRSTTEGDSAPEKESSEEDGRGEIDTTSNSYAAAASVTSTDSSLHSMPIVVTSTEPPYSSMSSSFKTSVESEKVEVIEIKSDGNSGLLPPRIFNSGLKKK